jgi:hypothetical protein
MGLPPPPRNRKARYLFPLCFQRGPFDVFTFSPASASVYQLGNVGTARKELKAWDLKP